MPEPRRNGCWNRKAFLPALIVQDGWQWVDIGGVSTRVPVYKRISFRNRMDCVYSTDPLVGSKDPGCVGCRWKQSPLERT